MTVSDIVGAGRSSRMTTVADALERIGAVGPSVAFYRRIPWDLARTTSGLGVVLLLGMVAVSLYRLIDSAAMSFRQSVPAYFLPYPGVVAAVALVAAACMCIDRHRVITRIGWAVGALVCLADMATYLTGRAAGLSSLGEPRGRWDYPLGTFAIALDVLYVLTYLAVLTGLANAIPDTRDGRD